VKNLWGIASWNPLTQGQLNYQKICLTLDAANKLLYIVETEGYNPEI